MEIVPFLFRLINRLDLYVNILCYLCASIKVAEGPVLTRKNISRYCKKGLPSLNYKAAKTKTGG